MVIGAESPGHGPGIGHPGSWPRTDWWERAQLAQCDAGNRHTDLRGTLCCAQRLVVVRVFVRGTDTLIARDHAEDGGELDAEASSQPRKVSNRKESAFFCTLFLFPENGAAIVR